MARMSQCFGTTQPSLTLTADQVVRIDDIGGSGSSCHTDGVGLISKALALELEDKLYDGLPAAQRAKKVPSTCFQVHFILPRVALGSHLKLF